MTGWHAYESATPDDLLAWAGGEPWGRAMRACQQDAGWHAEGDVWTHTAMVVGELQRLGEWPDLPPADRLSLVFAALFHDAGKPATTVTDPATGRTHAPKHALAGTALARRVLRDLGCPLGVREGIAALVRYHGRPPFLLERPDPARELIGLSWVLRHRLLYLLALADTRGRRTADAGRPEDAVELWREAADEHGCLDRPFPFANDHARFLFFRDALSDVRYAPREGHRCAVTLLSGLPAAGKDRWLADHRPGLPAVSLDDLRAEHGVDPADDQGGIVQLARAACRVHLRAGRDFAFNATNTVRPTRSRWVDLFAGYGAWVEIVYIEPPLADVRRRNAARPHPVPGRVIDRLAERLEPPTWAEGHALALVG